MSDTRHHVDVAIVGFGPTGAALANALGAQGLSVAVIDRHQGVLQMPRAVHLDGETMRTLHALGLSAEALQVLRPGSVMHWVNARQQTLLTRAGTQGLGPQGWHGNYYYHQPQLEAVLRAGLRRYPQVWLMEGEVLQSITQDAQGVTLSLQTDAVDDSDAGNPIADDPASQGVALAMDVAEGAGSRHTALSANLPGSAPRTLRARYVVGCDGARSLVRDQLGLSDFEDLGDHQAWLVVDAVLKRPLNLPEHTVQFCNPARPATAVYVHPLRRRWELMLLPGEDPQAMCEPERVWDLLSDWIRPGQGELERAAVYTFHSLVANQWQRDRVLLVGDAVHQTPPFLGQGLCAGLRDVANLGWKLGHALRRPDRAEALLASYGPERRPHARAFVALAVEVGRIIQETDPVKAAERDERLLAQGLAFHFPSPVLGKGVHQARDAAPMVGQVAPQFECTDGTWTDDAAPGAWSVWLAPELAAALDGKVRRRLADAGVVVIEALGEAGGQWLQSQQAQAAVLRPDRYLFDLCRDGGELAAALDGLATWGLL